MRTPLALAALLALAAPVAGRPAFADEPPSVAPLDESFSVGVVTGDGVNLRVGPRQDDVAVQQLAQGAVVVIVERAGEWLGVRVPEGFSGAVAAELTEPVDSEHVRVTGTDVNLRRGAGLEQPPFRDRLQRGDVLPVLAREGTWLIVEAPESVRAYVHSRYVEEKGPVSGNAERIAEGRKRREAREALRKELSTSSAAEADDGALRAEIGAVGKALADARAAGGYDVAPVGALEDRLEAAVATAKHPSERTKKLADALLADLRRECEIRVAFADEILAKKRAGQTPPERAKDPAEQVPAVDLKGTVRWEAAPGWDGGGAFVLYDGDKPSVALRWSGGDLGKLATGKDAPPTAVRVRGKQTGARMLGLPVVEVSQADRVP